MTRLGMNQNDMDRHIWRTGQRWSGDDRRDTRVTGRLLSNKMILLLLAAFIATNAYLFFR